MTEITALLQTLQSLSPLAVIALMGVIIFMLVKGNPWTRINQQLGTIQTNHLHELPAMAENIRQGLESQRRIESQLTELNTIIKERLPKP